MQFLYTIEANSYKSKLLTHEVQVYPLSDGKYMSTLVSDPYADLYKFKK